MESKRGQEQLHMYIFYTIMIIIILASLVYFISDVSSGKSIKKQVISKKIAMLLDSAQPGTEIELNSGGIDVSIQKNKVIVMVEGDKIGYEYEFYSPYGIGVIKEGGKTAIAIKE